MVKGIQILEPVFGETPNFPVCTMDLQTLRNGLLVRTPNWLGDVMMTLPALGQLRKMLPKYCALVVQCPEAFVPFFESMPIVDRIFPLHNPHAFLNSKERQAVATARLGAGILFNGSLRDAISLKLAGIPHLYGSSSRMRSCLLHHSFAFPKRVGAGLNGPHQALRYLGMVSALGAPEWNGDLPEMNPRREPELWSEELRAALDAESLLVLAPGAAYGDAKRWDAEKFSVIAETWLTRGGCVACVGTKSEFPVAARVLEGHSVGRVWNFAGKTSLAHLMLLLKHAQMIVANDSGVMHLGACIGGKGVAIFGSTDYLATGPLSKRWRVVYASPSCGPCFKRDCPNGTRECFNGIEAHHVQQAMDALLK